MVPSLLKEDEIAELALGLLSAPFPRQTNSFWPLSLGGRSRGAAVTAEVARMPRAPAALRVHAAGRAGSVLGAPCISHACLCIPVSVDISFVQDSGIFIFFFPGGQK